MERLSRTKAIRMKCLDCCADQLAEVRKCPVTNCPLWRYRMGKEINDELKPDRKKKENTDLLDDFDEDFLE
jgi:hypothetical protein